VQCIVIMVIIAKNR